LILELPFSLKAEKQGDEAIKSLFFETKTFNYKETRNGMVGEDYSSFSAGWLWAVFHQEFIMKLKDTKTKWLTSRLLVGFFELLWRDFFDLCSKTKKFFLIQE
jgi:deoxyribodipyrimidine photo-lyase